MRKDSVKNKFCGSYFGRKNSELSENVFVTMEAIKDEKLLMTHV